MNFTSLTDLPKFQRNVDYYIPSVLEIDAMEKDMYPSDKIEYRQMLDFYAKIMNYDCLKARFLTAKAFAIIAAGGLLSDYMNEIEEDNVEFKSEEEVSQFANIFCESLVNIRKASLLRSIILLRLF